MEWNQPLPEGRKELGVLDEFIAGCFSVSDWQMEEGGREIKASQACSSKDRNRSGGGWEERGAGDAEERELDHRKR